MTADQPQQPNRELCLQALDQARNGLYIVSDGTLETVNQQLLELTGYDREELLGKPPERLYHEESIDERHRRLQLLREDDRESVSWACRFVTKSGTELPIQLEQTLVEGATDAVIGRVRDVREEDRQEQKLEILTRALRHNIRNQMNLAVGHAETLQEIEQTDYRTAAEQIEEVGKRVISLADKARKAQQHLDVPPEEECRINLVDSAALVVDKFRIKQAQTTVETAFPERAPAVAPPSFEVALMELMENAATHHESGAGPVRVSIDREQGTTAIHVEDECEPVPPAVIDTIDRGEEQPLRHNDGLGLWIARWIADTVNGELVFSRLEDESGNRVTLRFESLDSLR